MKINSKSLLTTISLATFLGLIPSAAAETKAKTDTVLVGSTVHRGEVYAEGPYDQVKASVNIKHLTFGAKVDYQLNSDQLTYGTAFAEYGVHLGHHFEIFAGGELRYESKVGHKGRSAPELVFGMHKGFDGSYLRGIVFRGKHPYGELEAGKRLTDKTSISATVGGTSHGINNIQLEGSVDISRATKVKLKLHHNLRDEPYDSLTAVVSYSL